MTSNRGNLVSLLILASGIASTTAGLNVASVACSDDYDISLQSVSFACDDGCKFGASGTASSECK